MTTKFRIWDHQARRYVENSCSLHCFSNWAIDPFTGEICDWVQGADGLAGKSENPDYYFNGTEIVTENRYFAEQYTGRKDEFGKEIYEGDIVEYQLGTVKYRSKIGWECDGWRTISFNDDSSDSFCAGISTVIGNIHENPELLK